ncbi:YlbL family protein [Paenibacillus sp. sgz302251]|uniref:YlbL family protein n=1 Tax=Paenibacillus sp. sgz302251 TaxID=3414493 RepID=UPI003C7B6DFD
MQEKRSDFRRLIYIVIVTALMMWILLYAPTPYVVYEPGLAVPVEPMISIEEGDRLGDGEFLLTAVKMTEPNFLSTLQSMWDSSKDVYLKRDVLRGYSRQQYVERLNVIMQGSQNNAVEAAYRHAGLPYKSKPQAIIVSDAYTAENRLLAPFQAGDKLLGLTGGARFENIEELFGLLQALNKEPSAAFDVERGEEVIRVLIPARAQGTGVTEEERLKALGIISLTELRSLEPDDPRYHLTIAAGEIGGPSAGLVFTLQALDLLTEGDLSGGHRIAATGTITADGKVGAIGGIKQKIVISSEEGAQLFLAPADNFKEADEKARSIDTSMKVVSVATLQEALDRIEEFKESE